MMDGNLEIYILEREGSIPKVVEKLIETFHSYHPASSINIIKTGYSVETFSSRSRTDDNLNSEIRKMQGRSDRYYNFPALISLLQNLLVNQA